MLESIIRRLTPISQFLLSGLCVIVVYIVHQFYKSKINDDLSSLKGPKLFSWIFGNVPELTMELPGGKTMMEWFDKYGAVFRGYGCFREEILLVSDPSAIRHIFANPSVFPKTQSHQFLNLVLFGSSSLFYVQGEDHRKLRSIANPMFSSAAVRSVKSIFIQAAQDLVDNLSKDYTFVTDMYQPVHEATLRAVSEALMGDERGSIEIYRSAYESLILALGQRSKSAILSATIISSLPTWVKQLIVNHPPPVMQKFRHHRMTARDISAKLLHKRTEHATVKEDSSLFDHFADANDKASKKLSRDELLDHFGTLTVAGEDSTASELLWILYELALNPDWQEKIRNEIRRALVTENPVQLDYDKLLYLNAFIKEVLRYYPVLPITERTVSTDTMIPMSHPVTTASGTALNEIRVRKGRTIWISVMAYNRSPSVWGPDANMFKPSRWLNQGNVASELSIGPYANLLTFLGGPRSCPGWRFAILEIQVMVTEMVKTLLISLPDNVTIRPALALVLVPFDDSGKASLPLKLERID